MLPFSADSKLERLQLACRKRYEVSLVKDASISNQEGEPAYLKFCKCRTILPEDLLLERGVPLPSEDTESICSRVSWEALQVCISVPVFQSAAHMHTATLSSVCICSGEPTAW